MSDVPSTPDTLPAAPVDSMQITDQKQAITPTRQGLEWQHASADRTPVVQIDGVYLGVKVGPDGWNAGYIDEVETPVPDAGVTFVVEQASYGFTGISAGALPGSHVEALSVDPETQAITWLPANEHDGRVRVTGDWGNLADSDPEDPLPTADLGNPGGRAGVIRVTNEHGTRYYVLGADFQGEPDSWIVKGGMVEVVPTDPEALAEPKQPIAASEALELAAGEQFSGTIRPVQPGDSEKLRDILAYWVKNPQTGETFDEEVDSIIYAIEAVARGGNGRLYNVAINENGEIIGVMGLTKPNEQLSAHAQTSNPLEIINAFVDNSARGSGAGKALVKELEDLARTKNATELIVSSGPRYEQSGWPFWTAMFGTPIAVEQDLYGPGAHAPVWHKVLT